MNRNTLKKVAIFFIAGAIAGCLGLLFEEAHAGTTYTGKPKNCESIGGFAGNLVEARYVGVPWSQVEADLKTAVAEAIRNPKSYIKNADDQASVLNLFKQVYDNTGLTTSEQAFSFAYSKCMGVSEKTHFIMVKGGHGKKAHKAFDDATDEDAVNGDIILAKGGGHGGKGKAGKGGKKAKSDGDGESAAA